MLRLSETEDAVIAVTPIERMPAQAEAEIVPVAEKAMPQVIVAAAATALKRDLVRPAPVDAALG